MNLRSYCTTVIKFKKQIDQVPMFTSVLTHSHVLLEEVFILDALL